MKNLNNKGFSLIEMLIAVTILAVGLLAVAGLQVTAIQGNSHGNTISQATTLAEDRIEAIRNMDYAAIVYAPNPSIESNVDGTIYTRETLVEVDIPLPDLKRITVTVRWDTNRPHQIVLRTIIANGG
jgi:type IV pilus assembly protein PilV